MTTIGLTGPTGSGKTTVLTALEDLGCRGVDCDALYHRLLETSPDLQKELTDAFGRGILNHRGGVNRKALGRAVYAAPGGLDRLNALTARYLLPALDREVEQAHRAGAVGVVIDAIRLLESGLDARCAATVAVVAPPEVRLARIMARDGISEEYALARMAVQPPPEYYVNRCHHVIVNDGSLPPEALRAQVEELFRPILHI